MNETQGSPRWRYYTLLLALIATVALYLPGISGPFIHDDAGQITVNDDIKIDRVTVDNLQRSVAHYPSRPLPMMSFAINHADCGLNPSCFKFTNIVIHALTGLALFLFLAVLRQIGERRALFHMPVWLPVIVSALWLLHPLQVSTVLYVVQRMAQLSTLFSLLALTFYLLARFEVTTLRARAVWFSAAAACFALGMLSKENTALVVPLAGLLEVLLLSPRQRQRIPRPTLTGWLLAAFLLTALCLLALYPVSRIASSYAQRDFLPIERLLTESRIVWYYASEVLWPDPARMSVFLDIFPISHSLTDPWTTLPAVAGWFLATGAALAALLRGPSLIAFGVLFFVIGHLLESTVLGLALTYEHRNYGALIGLLLAVACAAWSALRQPRLRIVAAVLGIALCTVELAIRVQTWSTEQDLATHMMTPNFSGSYNGTLHVAAFFDQQANHHADNPVMSRLYRDKATTAYRHAATLSAQPYAPLSILVLRFPATQDEVWPQLFAVAATQPVTFDALNWTNYMATCLLVPVCPVSRDDFAHYLDLLLANPRSPHVIRIKLERTAGTFFTKVYNDPDKGLALARKAAQSGSEDARESLIKNLAYLGRTDEARREYEALVRDANPDDRRRQRIEQALAQPGVVLPMP